MIKVKAIRAREVGMKFGRLLLTVIGGYLLLVILIHFLHTTTSLLATEMIEEVLYPSKDYLVHPFNLLLVQKELALEQEVLDQVFPVYVAENVPQSYPMHPSVTDSKVEENKVESPMLEVPEVEAVSRPLHYEVKEYPSGKIQVGKAMITNYSTLKLDLNELSKPSTQSVRSDMNILIFHTHTSEAYSEIGQQDNFRTTNDNYNVVAVGEALKEYLQAYGFSVLHDKTKHDTPSYNGAYNASCDTVEKLVAKQKYEMIIDLHRDALSRQFAFPPNNANTGRNRCKNDVCGGNKWFRTFS